MFAVSFWPIFGHLILRIEMRDWSITFTRQRKSEKEKLNDFSLK